MAERGSLTHSSSLSTLVLIPALSRAQALFLGLSVPTLRPPQPCSSTWGASTLLPSAPCSAQAGAVLTYALQKAHEMDLSPGAGALLAAQLYPALTGPPLALHLNEAIRLHRARRGAACGCGALQQPLHTAGAVGPSPPRSGGATPLCQSTRGGFHGTAGPSTRPAASWASSAQGGSGMQLLCPPPNVGLNPRLGGAWGQLGPATPLPGTGVALRPPAAVVPGTSDRFYGFWRETAGREAERKQRPPPRPSLQPLRPPHPAPGGPRAPTPRLGGATGPGLRAIGTGGWRGGVR